MSTPAVPVAISHYLVPLNLTLSNTTTNNSTNISTNINRFPYAESESELFRTSNTVNIYYNSIKMHTNNIIILTTHRLIWYNSNDSTTGYYLHLADLVSAELHGQLFSLIHLPRVHLLLQQKTILYPIGVYRDIKTGLWPTTVQPIQLPVPMIGPTIELKFNNGDYSTFIQQYAHAAKTALWQQLATIATNTVNNSSSKKDFSTSSAGITGIIRTVNDSNRRTERTLDTAFTDLQALMKNAAEIVALADRFANQTNNSNNNNSDTLVLNSVLTSLGILNPVTKQSAGSDYQILLAKQLVQFLIPLLTNNTNISNNTNSNITGINNGLLSLIDLYCLYNRARGTEELVSPEDLLAAARLLSQYSNNTIQLREFPATGVLIIVLVSTSTNSDNNSITNKSLTSRLIGLLPSTDLLLSQQLNLSLLVLSEELNELENTGLIVRDETIAGIIYYQNQFEQFYQQYIH